MSMARRKKRRRKGVSALAMSAILALVTLFIGLFMIAKVANITAIENGSDFYDVYTSLVSNTSTIYDVLILVVIVFVLGFAIQALRGFSKSTTGAV